LILPRILALAALALQLNSAEPPAWAPPIVNRVRTTAFPELSKAPIHIKELESASDFFRARPRLIDFLLPQRMHYTLLVNRKASGLAATDPMAIEAIIAHELEHISSYTSHPRWRMLGLVRLIKLSCEIRWERAADERAITRGYGLGLIRYRRWLYGAVSPQVAARKRRVYLTPEEIEQRLRRSSQTISPIPAGWCPTARFAAPISNASRHCVNIAR
jgi:hypothetical protein